MSDFSSGKWAVLYLLQHRDSQNTPESSRCTFKRIFYSTTCLSTYLLNPWKIRFSAYFSFGRPTAGPRPAVGRPESKKSFSNFLLLALLKDEAHHYSSLTKAKHHILQELRDKFHIFYFIFVKSQFFDFLGPAKIFSIFYSGRPTAGRGPARMTAKKQIFWPAMGRPTAGRRPANSKNQ